jgi:hypothetical protein
MVWASILRAWCEPRVVRSEYLARRGALPVGEATARALGVFDAMFDPCLFVIDGRPLSYGVRADVLSGSTRGSQAT